MSGKNRHLIASIPRCNFSKWYRRINCILVSRQSCIFYICRLHSNAAYLGTISSPYNHTNYQFDSRKYESRLESTFLSTRKRFEVSGIVASVIFYGA